MSLETSSEPDDPDLAILLAAANRVLNDRLLAAMAEAGLTMRVVRGATSSARCTPSRCRSRGWRSSWTSRSRLPSRPWTTWSPRAWSSGSATPDDGRRKLVGLTDEGRRVRATALGVSCRARGRDRRTCRCAPKRALLGIDQRHGDLEHVPREALARRVVTFFTRRGRAWWAGRRARRARRRSSRPGWSPATGRAGPRVIEREHVGDQGRGRGTRPVWNVQPRVYISSSGSGVSGSK